MGQHGLGESDTRTPGTEGEARGLQARSGTQARHRTARRRPQGWRSGGPSVSGQEAQGTPGVSSGPPPPPGTGSPGDPGVRSGPPPPSPG